MGMRSSCEGFPVLIAEGGSVKVSVKAIVQMADETIHKQYSIPLQLCRQTPVAVRCVRATLSFYNYCNTSTLSENRILKLQ